MLSVKRAHFNRDCMEAMSLVGKTVKDVFYS